MKCHDTSENDPLQAAFFILTHRDPRLHIHINTHLRDFPPKSHLGTTRPDRVTERHYTEFITVRHLRYPHDIA